MKKLILLAFIISSTFLKSQNNYIQNSPLPCIDKTFFLYIHIALDSLGSPIINEQELHDFLAPANAAFKPICIQFDYCKVDYIKDYYFGRIKSYNDITMLVSRFQKERRINLYIVNSVLNKYINSYSTFDAFNNVDNAIIIVPKSGKGLIHELGHAFGLLHTFETKFGDELVNGSNCDFAGDLICDTPADPYKLGQMTEGFFDVYNIYSSSARDANNEEYVPDIGNYMSHFFDYHCFFTRQQYIKMAKNYLEAPIKLW